MSTKTTLWFAFCLALVFSACQQEQDSTIQTEDQLLQVHTVDEITGVVEIDGSLIKYQVEDLTTGTNLTVEIDGKILAATLNYDELSLTYNGNDNTLSPTQMLALNQLSIQLATAILPATADTEVTVSRAENTLIRVLSHWSEAPVNHVYGKATMVSDLAKGNGNDGISCIRKRRWYTLTYDQGSNGARTTVSRKAGYDGGGDYDCMGRCGADCGRWWIPSSWTLDCFEHDECSLRYNASGGSSDANCGDEWWHASDDWTFGVIAGCNGR